jgi:DoxX-like family
MNIALWTLQILLALHTLMGAIWKYSNSEQSVPSLKALPHGVWLGLGVAELACAIGLVLPLLMRSKGTLAPAAALVIAAEMALYCVLHLASGQGKPGELAYWLVVAAFCAFIAYGRIVLKPI